MHKLERENKKLKEILARKDEKFNRMVRKKDRDLVKKDREITKNAKELDIERRLWKNRAADWDPGDSTDLHRIEVFDGIISDESSLYSATLKTKKKFQHILEHAEVYVAASDKMRLFRDDESRDLRSRKQVQAASPARHTHGTGSQKRQPHAGRAAGNIRDRPRPACAGISR